MKIFKFSIILFCFINYSYSQHAASDISLLANKDYSILVKDNNFRHNVAINTKAPIVYKHRSFIAKLNPLRFLATSAMLLYQNIISPQIFRYCLYERSCSNFSKKAIEEFGLFKGIFLSADRIMRCNVFTIDEIYCFDDCGYAIDEPSFYRIKKK